MRLYQGNIPFEASLDHPIWGIAPRPLTRHSFASPFDMARDPPSGRHGREKSKTVPTSAIAYKSPRLARSVSGPPPGKGSMLGVLVPLDQESHWYRYHPLLAEYLSQRLASELGNEIPGLHQRAALWYASQELWSDAVQHAIAAGDAVRALSWMENCAMPLVKRGDLFTLLGWQRLSHPCSCGVSPRSGLRSPGGWHSPSGMTRRSSSRVK
jgi:hypothetical protein